MTENEVIEWQKAFKKTYKGVPKDVDTACDIAIKALEEIQQYRAIGTVERFQQLSEQFKHHVTDETSCPERHCNKCDKYRKENEKYHAIGTVEECREARERQKAKKPIMKPFYEDMEEEYLCCPNCGDILTDRIPVDNKDFYLHCLNCGQKFDWSDNE